MKLIKNYLTPTNIYIVGSCDFKDKKSYLITDDYCQAVVIGNKAKQYLETDGGVTIFESKEELLESLKDVEYLENMETLKYTYFENFVGKIYLSLIDEETEEDAFKNEIDFDDYLMYQYDDGIYENEWRDLTFRVRNASYTTGETRDLSYFFEQNNINYDN